MSCYEKALKQREELIKLGKIDSVKCILSYGGGVNSSALFFYLLEKNYKIDLVIFSDTGEEEDSTYKAVEDMKIICKDNNIEFVVVRSKFGGLYDYYYSKKAVPSIMRRDCTSKFKISPIRQYIRKRFGKKTNFLMYIGIASDERKRVTSSDVKYMTYIYPFVDDNITRKGNFDILEKNNFVAVKSGCKGCPFIKKVDWVNMFKSNRKEFDRWLRLEQNNSAYPKVLLNGSYKLELIKTAWKNQSVLSQFEDNEIVCNGGCFL